MATEALEAPEREQILTPNQIAEMLGVHPETVRCWLKDGSIKGVKISQKEHGRWRIHRSELDKLNLGL